VPNGWVLTADELKNLRFRTYKRVFDGEEKIQYLITHKDKTYYAPQIVMSLIRKAINEPALIRVQLNITGKDKATRYDLQQFLKG